MRFGIQYAKAHKSEIEVGENMKKLKSNRWLWICMCVVAGLWCLSFTVNTRVYATIDALGRSEAAFVFAASGATEPTISYPTCDDKGSASLPGANSSDTATKNDIKDESSVPGIQKLGDSVVKAGHGDTATLQSTATGDGTSLTGGGTRTDPYKISSYAKLKDFAS